MALPSEVLACRPGQRVEFIYQKDESSLAFVTGIVDYSRINKKGIPFLKVYVGPCHNGTVASGMSVSFSGDKMSSLICGD